MSETAKKLFESLKEVKETVLAVAPGLGNLVPEVTAETSRLATQGAMELASALFSHHGFVPYGPGQYTPSVEYQQDAPAQPPIESQAEMQVEQGRQSRGMER
jgi:hypothetical protein